MRISLVEKNSVEWLYSHCLSDLCLMNSSHARIVVCQRELELYISLMETNEQMHRCKQKTMLI